MVAEKMAIVRSASPLISRLIHEALEHNEPVDAFRLIDGSKSLSTRELLLRNRFPISGISSSVVMHGVGAEQLGNVLILVEKGVYVLQFYYTDSCDFYLFAAFRSIGLPRRKCTNAVSRPSTTWSC